MSGFGSGSGSDPYGENVVFANANDKRLKMLRLLNTSAMLQQAIPKVRCLALSETIRHAPTEEDALGFLLTALSDSPYIPDERKDPLANLVYEDDWTELFSTLGCSEAGSGYARGLGTEFQQYREMVVSIFSRSRKINQLPDSRKIALGAAIHLCSTKESLKHLAIRSLETTTAFDDMSRNMVANDIFDDRYDLLLLPDRFDCEELQRRFGAPRRTGSGRSDHSRASSGAASSDAGDSGDGGAVGDGSDEVSPAPAAALPASSAPPSEEEDECPICLGTNEIDCIVRPCNHEFCETCITGWLQNNDTCPLCRADIETHQPIE